MRVFPLAPSPRSGLTSSSVDEEPRSTMTAMSKTDRTLSPAETAKRLGVSVKALRLYERHGLVAPLRSAADWRVYGPDQIARLHQVLALKRLGLSLSRIAQLLSGGASRLGDVLALQEQVLQGESHRVSHALALVRAARRKLANGETLSIDDLTQLTKETTMTRKATDEEMKAIFDPLTAKHFTPEQLAELGKRPTDQAEATREWDALIAEAKALMVKGDPASSAAIDLARRWQAQVAKFTGGDPEMFNRLGHVWKDAMADPKAAPKLPMNQEIFAFVGKAMEKLKERECE